MASRVHRIGCSRRATPHCRCREDLSVKVGTVCQMAKPLHLLVAFGVGEYVSRPPALTCCVQQLQAPAASCIIRFAQL
jgi:hypothetical protein